MKLTPADIKTIEDILTRFEAGESWEQVEASYRLGGPKPLAVFAMVLRRMGATISRRRLLRRWEPNLRAEIRAAKGRLKARELAQIYNTTPNAIFGIWNRKAEHGQQ